ncbi:MAG: phosphoribosylformylglycinamidine synthase subunit PurS [Endomicrobiales bacterium]
MRYHVEVYPKKGFPEHHGEHVRHDIKEMGMTGAPRVRYSQVYRFEGDLTPAEANDIASKLLIDPVTEEYRLEAGDPAPAPARGAKKRHEIEVWLKHGVTDTVAESVVKAVRDLGITKEVTVKTGHKFVFEGTITPAAARQVAERLLVNLMVQEYTLNGSKK